MSQGMHAIARGIQWLVDTERAVQVAGAAADCLEPTPANLRAFFLAGFVESGELLQELNWKPWKAARGVDRARVLDELADVLAFLALQIHYVMELTGADAQAVAEAFLLKSKLNAERLSGQVEGYKYDGSLKKEPPAPDQAAAWPPQSYATQCVEGHTLEWTSENLAVCYTPVSGGHQPTWWKRDEGNWLVPDRPETIHTYHPNWQGARSLVPRLPRNPKGP